jgi:hypothetical protein
MKTTIYVVLISVILTGCHFSKSVKKDLVSGLTSVGNNLSCDDVYISVKKDKTSRKSFIYGEIFYLNFNDIKGFASLSGKVFPGLRLTIVNQAGDTIMKYDDLYSGYKDGLDYSPLLLSTNITLASPIRSNSDYTLYSKIWDKKGSGTFSSKFDFKVVGNDQITREGLGVTFNEIYLFSEDDKKVITDNKAKVNDNIHIIVEGLTGFKEENKLLFPGLSLKITDAAKNSILDYKDLFLDYSETGVSVTDFFTRVSSHFKVSEGKINNPLECEMVIWDKKSNARLKVRTNIILD